MNGHLPPLHHPPALGYRNRYDRDTRSGRKHEASLFEPADGTITAARALREYDDGSLVTRTCSEARFRLCAGLTGLPARYRYVSAHPQVPAEKRDPQQRPFEQDSKRDGQVGKENGYIEEALVIRG